MAEITYYNQQNPDWDKKAVRFETGARPVACYRLPCKNLTFPYTPLTWLMHNYVKEIYLADPVYYERQLHCFWRSIFRLGPFWNRIRGTAMFQYEFRVNHGTVRRKFRILNNIVTIYCKIASDGFNVAKPIPVVENRRGELVPLKGAKRIASLLLLGVPWVPVCEFDSHSLTNIPPEQMETSCIDHSAIIFQQLVDLEEVRSLKRKYDNPVKLLGHYDTRQANAIIWRQVIRYNREAFYGDLLAGNSSLVTTVSSFDLLAPPLIWVVIDQEIEALAWLLRRFVRCNLLITHYPLAEMLSTPDIRTGLHRAGISLYYYSEPESLPDIATAQTPHVVLVSKAACEKIRRTCLETFPIVVF